MTHSTTSFIIWRLLNTTIIYCKVTKYKPWSIASTHPNMSAMTRVHVLGTKDWHTSQVTSKHQKVFELCLLSDPIILQNGMHRNLWPTPLIFKFSKKVFKTISVEPNSDFWTFLALAPGNLSLTKSSEWDCPASKKLRKFLPWRQTSGQDCRSITWQRTKLVYNF